MRKGMGIRLGDSVSDCLTNLRFADDVLLLQHASENVCATSREAQKNISAIKVRTRGKK